MEGESLRGEGGQSEGVSEHIIFSLGVENIQQYTAIYSRRDSVSRETKPSAANGEKGD